MFYSACGEKNLGFETLEIHFLTPYPRRGFREIPDSVTFRTFEGARAPATPGTLADRPGPFLTTQRRYLTPIVWSWDAARDP